MSASRPAPAEPRTFQGPVLFEEGDFHGLSEGLARDSQYNDRRLVARRKLLTLGKQAVAAAKAEGLALECRTSLHNPNAFNGHRVNRLWAYLVRPKAEKRRLRGVLGAELAKDLDAAFRNAYLCLALESDALEVGLRIHPDAWYDGQNLKHRLEREGLAPWRALLNELTGFRVQLHDWKGEWRCGDLATERLEELLGYYVPGEHSLAVLQRFPAPAGNRGPALEEGAAEHLLAELTRLLPLYRFTAWSAESDFLFSR
jgi:hypothetical protein